MMLLMCPKHELRNGNVIVMCVESDCQIFSYIYNVTYSMTRLADWGADKCQQKQVKSSMAAPAPAASAKCQQHESSNNSS